jgi:hypothetical protein
MNIAFETECFYDKDRKIRGELVGFVLMLLDGGNTVYLWSGYGLDYIIAEAKKFGLWEKGNLIASVKAASTPDIVFDIRDVNLGVINVKICKATTPKREN